MASFISGGNVGAATNERDKRMETTNQPSTAAPVTASKPSTRNATRHIGRTPPSKAEALELLTSVLNMCKQSGLEVRMGPVPADRVIGIIVAPARIEVVDGVTFLKPADSEVTK